MIPPLGYFKRETRHLNLQWSVADLDRLAIIQAHPRMTLDEIDLELSRKSRACPRADILKICRLAGVPEPSQVKRSA